MFLYRIVVGVELSSFPLYQGVFYEPLLDIRLNDLRCLVFALVIIEVELSEAYKPVELNPFLDIRAILLPIF